MRFSTRTSSGWRLLKLEAEALRIRILHTHCCVSMTVPSGTWVPVWGTWWSHPESSIWPTLKLTTRTSPATDRMSRHSSHMQLKQPRWHPDSSSSHCPDSEKTHTSTTPDDQRVQSDPCLEEQEKPGWVLGSGIYPLLKPSLKITSHPENQHGRPEKTRERQTTALCVPAHSSSEVIVFCLSLSIFLFSIRRLVIALLFFLSLWFSNHGLRFSLETLFDWNESTLLFLACCQTRTVFYSCIVSRPSLLHFLSRHRQNAERIWDYQHLVGRSV